MNKINAFLNGLILSLKGIKTFKPTKTFNGKRVAIVGPADSAFEEEKGSFIDQFDYVVRINKAPSTWKFENEKFTGARTDIWFHSFFENNESGGGPLTKDIFLERNISIVINPRTNFQAYRRSFTFYKKHSYFIPVFHLQNKFYNSLKNEFPSSLKPTIGLTALFTILQTKCKEVYITGFTFFKTPYAQGYRDHLVDMKANANHIKDQGQHDVNLEYKIFKHLLKISPCMRIEMDQKLKTILKEDADFVSYK